MAKAEYDKTLDLRGVACPQNAAKALLELAMMDVGEKILINIDDGEPVNNVCLSIDEEGYKLLEKKKEEDSWKLLILKE